MPTGSNIVSWSDADVSMPRLSIYSDPTKYELNTVASMACQSSNTMHCYTESSQWCHIVTFKSVQCHPGLNYILNL